MEMTENTDAARELRRWCLGQAAETVRAIMGQAGQAGSGYDLTWARRATMGLARDFERHVSGDGADTPQEQAQTPAPQPEPERTAAPLLTATDLLRRAGRHTTAADFNRRMERAGLLERHDGGWRLTPAGLDYGGNLCAGTAKERPAYHPARFGALLRILYNHKKTRQ